MQTGFAKVELDDKPPGLPYFDRLQMRGQMGNDGSGHCFEKLFLSKLSHG